MDISNFKLTDVIGSGPLTWKYKGVVDVTTKRFLRKPVTVKREIFKSFAGCWYFIDTGDFTPSSDIENLVRKLLAETGKELQHSLNT